jgi:hypothetical protein
MYFSALLLLFKRGITIHPLILSLKPCQGKAAFSLSLLRGEISILGKRFTTVRDKFALYGLVKT